MVREALADEGADLRAQLAVTREERDRWRSLALVAIEKCSDCLREIEMLDPASGTHRRAMARLKDRVEDLYDLPARRRQVAA